MSAGAGKKSAMRSWVGLVAFLYGFFAVLLTVEAAFAAWCDTPEESALPLMAAGATVLLPVLVLRALKRDPVGRFKAGGEWAKSHPIAASAVMAAPLLVVSFIWGLVVGDTWRENAAWSLGGAAGLFVGLVLIGYAEQAIRRREARKRGIAVADYKPGKLARRLGWGLAALVAIYLALGLAIELSDVLG